jgi:CheY-like chemotaxis protein
VIRDTGVGMTSDVQERIFEPFFSTKGDDGTGLGLATVYGIVKQSDGFIVVDSEPNRGTTFTLFFPFTSQATAATIAAPAPAEVPGHQTILVVEDEAAVRSLVVAGLRRSGYQVVEAADPTSALEVASAVNHLDLLLADLMLPEMNGSLLAGEVQKLWPGVRVSFMSGYPDADMVKRGFLGPVDPFLQKPFSLQALTSHVRAVLRDTPAAVQRPNWPGVGASAAVA